MPIGVNIAKARDLQKERFRQVRKPLLDALAVDPEDTLALILHGTIKINLGQYEEGLETDEIGGVMHNLKKRKGTK
mgnify:CR=1 FL=1